jgi:hypothetical protein
LLHLVEDMVGKGVVTRADRSRSKGCRGSMTARKGKLIPMNIDGATAGQERARPSAKLERISLGKIVKSRQISET